MPNDHEPGCAPRGADIDVVECACLNAHHDNLRRHESEVRAWAREIFRVSKSATKGFVPCQPFPTAPSFRPTCALSCARFEGMSHA
jgi:hypothetical protein